MGEVDAFEVPGIKRYFPAADHHPQHFECVPPGCVRGAHLLSAHQPKARAQLGVQAPDAAERVQRRRPGHPLRAGDEEQAYPALGRIAPAGRARFEIEADGMFLHWLEARVRLTVEDLRLATDPVLCARAQARRLAHDQSFGTAVRALRESRGVARAGAHRAAPAPHRERLRAGRRGPRGAGRRSRDGPRRIPRRGRAANARALASTPLDARCAVS